MTSALARFEGDLALIEVGHKAIPRGAALFDKFYFLSARRSSTLRLPLS